jgi:hypothetical protein
MEFKFKHYSHKPIEKVESRDQKKTYGNGKPVGFWLSEESADGGWAEWCEMEDFDGAWEYIYDVILSEDANILYLDGDSMVRFNELYGNKRGFGMDKIDWHAVARDYDGIVIAPYQWRHRMNFMWYYGWDCSSGCIWNGDAIEQLILRG